MGEIKADISHVAHDVGHLHELIEHMKTHVVKCQDLCSSDESHKSEIREHLGHLDTKIHEIEDHLKHLVAEH